MHLPWPLLFVVLCRLSIASGVESSAAADDATASMVEELFVLQGQLVDLLRSESNAMEETKNITSELTQLQKELNTTEIGKCNAEDSEAEYNKTMTTMEKQMEDTNKILKELNDERDSLPNQIVNVTQQIDTSCMERNRLTTEAKWLEDEMHLLQEAKDKAKNAYEEYGGGPDGAADGEVEGGLSREMDAANANYDEHCLKQRENQDSLKKVEDELTTLSDLMDTLKERENELNTTFEDTQNTLLTLDNKQTDTKDRRIIDISQQTMECEITIEELEKKISNIEEERREAKRVVRRLEANRKWMEREVREKMEELDEWMEKRERKEEGEGMGEDEGKLLE